MDNNKSQKVKIEESENFHPRRKMTSWMKMVVFFNFFCVQKTPYIKVRKVLKITGS